MLDPSGKSIFRRPLYASASIVLHDAASRNLDQPLSHVDLLLPTSICGSDVVVAIGCEIPGFLNELVEAR